MGVALQKTKLYFRAALFIAVLAMILIVLVKNRDNRVSVWFFHEFTDVNVVWLMLLTAAAALISAAVLRMVIRLYKDWRRLSQPQAQSQPRRQHAPGMAERPPSGPENEL